MAAAPKPIEFVDDAPEAVETVENEQLQLFPTIVDPLTKRARVKGTWQQFWGTYIFDFEDGRTYDLPMELFDYLRVRGCIYDTMA